MFALYGHPSLEDVYGDDEFLYDKRKFFLNREEYTECWDDIRKNATARTKNKARASSVTFSDETSSMSPNPSDFINSCK